MFSLIHDYANLDSLIKVVFTGPETLYQRSTVLYPLNEQLAVTCLETMCIVYPTKYLLDFA